jgi:hypothetical protein
MTGLFATHFIISRCGVMFCRGYFFVEISNIFGSKEVFKATAGSEDIFKPTTGIYSLQDISNDTGIKVANLATSNNLFAKRTMFTRRNIHKFTWTSPEGKTCNEINHILIDRRGNSSVLDVRSVGGADCYTDHCLVVAKFTERLAVRRGAL